MPPSPSLLSKYGPWAVVTGASSGIGEAFAVRLAAEGFSLVLTARREDLLNSLADKLSAVHDIETKVVPSDLSTADGYKPIAAATEALDVALLVNNAGIELHGSFFRDDVDAHLRLVAVNVAAMTALAHVFGRRFADARRGGIIFVSSISSRPTPWWATYGASKAFVSALAVSLRDELNRAGVDVLSLEPGPTASGMIDAMSRDVNFAKAGVSVMGTEVVVDEGLARLADGTARWVPGWVNRMQMMLIDLMPDWLRMTLGGMAVKRLMNNDLFTYT